MVRPLNPEHSLPFSTLLLDSCCWQCAKYLHLDCLLQSRAGLWCNMRKPSPCAALCLLSDRDIG